MAETIEQKWLSVKDLATRFGKHTRTIKTWRKKGILPPAVLDPSDQPRWSLETIEAWEKITYTT